MSNQKVTALICVRMLLWEHVCHSTVGQDDSEVWVPGIALSSSGLAV